MPSFEYVEQVDDDEELTDSTGTAYYNHDKYKSILPPNQLKDHTINPYQSLVRPLPVRIRTETRLSSFNEYAEEYTRIAHLKLCIAVQVLAGVGSITSAGLLIPFGSSHSDIIHTISFMFGLLYFISGLVAGITSRWRSSSSVKICLVVHLCAILLGIVAFVLGTLSCFNLFEGVQETARVELEAEHYDQATHALTGISMVCAVLEIFAASYIVFAIFRSWNIEADHQPLPVHL